VAGGRVGSTLSRRGTARTVGRSCAARVGGAPTHHAPTIDV
jgi:hypothetical protein